MEFKLVKLTQKDLDKAVDFAMKRAENSNLYKRRGSFKLSDITTGALAEIACYKLLKKCGYNVSKPDFEIYSNGRKSYAADLQGDGRYFHVKGQMRSSAERYGPSWLMQRSDPILNNPERGHYMMNCVVDEDRKEVYVYTCVPIISLVSQDCIGECTVPIFGRTKVAIYLHDIQSNLRSSRRWSILYKEINYV